MVEMLAFLEFVEAELADLPDRWRKHRDALREESG